MKFTTIPWLLLASVARSDALEGPAALPETHQLVRRDGISVVEQGLYNISNSTVALTKSIAGFNLAGLFALQAANAMAIETITNAASQIKGIADLTTTEAINLVPIIAQLVTTTNKSVATTISQKKAFGGVAPVVKANLQQQLKASQQLNAVIGTKLPTALLSTSAKSSQPIYDSINMGIAAFSTPFQNTPQKRPGVVPPSGHAGVSSVAPSTLAVFAALGVGAVISTL